MRTIFLLYTIVLILGLQVLHTPQAYAMEKELETQQLTTKLRVQEESPQKTQSMDDPSKYGEQSPKSHSSHIGRDYKEFVLGGPFTPSFTNLGTLDGGTESRALGVSFDGSVIIGDANDGSAQNLNIRKAFRWTTEKGMESLGTLKGAKGSCTLGISLDGSVVIGDTFSYDGDKCYQPRAFRWTGEKGMKSLGSLNGGEISSAKSINFDGSVIVGDAEDGAGGVFRAFRWTAEKGMESLGTLGTWSRAYGINFDGSVIVGEVLDGGLHRAFRWTAEKGMELLGALNGGTYSCALGVSFDGSVIIGNADDGAYNHPDYQGNCYFMRAFRWTAEKGMESLGTLNLATGSGPCDLNFDGSEIVGYTNSGSMIDPYEDRSQTQDRPFLWTAKKSMKSVEELLRDKGLLPPDLVLTKATAITPNGVVLVGEGVEYKGQMQTGNSRAWRAIIPRANLF